MKIAHQNISEEVTEYLQKLILTGSLDGRIYETKMAKKIGVSQSSVREAIKELEYRGLVERIPRKGSFVKSLSPEEIKEIFEIRTFLELKNIRKIIKFKLITKEDLKRLNFFVEEMIQVCRDEEKTREEKLFSVTNLDLKFHYFLWEKAKNPCAKRLLDNLYNQVQQSMFSDSDLGDNLEENMTKHFGIIEGLGKEDFSYTKSAYINHIIDVVPEIKEKIETSEFFDASK